MTKAKSKILLALCLLLCTFQFAYTKEGEDEFAIELVETYDKTKMVTDQKTVKFDDSVTSKRVISEMGFGWNLGNTFDAWNATQNQGLSSETCWGNPETEVSMIDALVRKGFKAIRIPVTWHNHLTDDKYTVDPRWMSRVKQVVDWCLERGMYVILNTHHDNPAYKEDPLEYGEGYFPLNKDKPESEKFLYNVWKQIATAFNNGYDHHLIFEGLNEPRMLGMKYEWSYSKTDDECKESEEVLNEFHRLILKAIRETDGNNMKRFYLVTGLAAGYDATLNSNLKFPDDSQYNPTNKRLMLSVHMYAPYEFAMKPDMEISKFTPAVRNTLYQQFKNLYLKFTKGMGINIVVGEMGTVNKNNTEDRMQWGTYYISSGRKFQFAAFTWDNGYYDNSLTCDDIFGHFHRKELTWENSDLIAAYLRAGKAPLWENNEVFDIEPITTFDSSKLVYDHGYKRFNNSVTAKQIVEELGFGWNLGNTFDAWNSSQNQGLDSETCWGNPETTEAMLGELISRGFRAIRIPVTWHNHLMDDQYTIDPAWMTRVKKVVDWCLDKGLYVILNTHHDNPGHKIFPIGYGEGYYPLNKDRPESEKFIFNVWRQIAIAFNNGYDHHLIFEGLNEPRTLGLPHEWWYEKGDPECEESEQVLNEYQRLILKAIRETGGNNVRRFYLVTGLAAGYDATLNSNLQIPNDRQYNPFNNKLLLSVHMYAPYEFAMKPDMDICEFTPDVRNTLYQQFKNLYLKFTKGMGIYIVVGEMGTVNKNNTEARIQWGEYYLGMSRKFHFSTFIWDNGYYDNSKTCDDIFGHFIRRELKWQNPTLIGAYLKAGNAPLEEGYEAFAAEPFETFDISTMVLDYGKRTFNDSVTSKDVINDLGFGWNLGNTFDAWNSSQNQGLSSETCWGNPETTPEMIDELVNKGFKAIRIPVTWHNHLVDDKYTVDPKWMSRVKQVVDWCLERGMYVILNTHHDNKENGEEELKYGQGYYPLKKHAAESEKFIWNVWRQIAYAFNDGYDHRLIFEGLNEPRTLGMEHEWWYEIGHPECEESAEVLNEFQKLIVKAIRESGGNNAKRFILITGLAAGYDATMKSKLVFPDDSKYNPKIRRLMLSVHMYAPYEFAMKPDMEISKFTPEVRNVLYQQFKSLYLKFTTQGVHIVVGEMGTVNKNNTDARIQWGTYYVSSGRKFQFAAFTWDNGYYDNSKTCDDIFGHFIRRELKWQNPSLITAYLNAAKDPLSDSVEVFEEDPQETYNDLLMELDYGAAEFDDSVTASQVVDEMGFGWNLGNTFDAWNSSQNQGLSSETCWGNPETTEAMIDKLVETGFKAIRIPVTWHNHLVDDKYTVDPNFMRRVKLVVNWCMKKGLYVILNTHHDNTAYSKDPMKYGQGYYPLNKDKVESERFIYNVWKQITYAFNNGYDHHLIFEGLNEPRTLGMPHEWWYEKGAPECLESASVLNEFNRLIVYAIRESGGNNAKRFILSTALSAGYDSTINSPFVIPDDKKYNPNNQKILLSVHMYAPYDFAMNPDMKLNSFTADYKAELDGKLANVYEKYVLNGYHVVVGEMGSINKNNTEARLKWGTYYIRLARQYEFSVFTWDNGYWDNSKTCDDIFGHFQREQLTWQNEDLIKAYIDAGRAPFGEDYQIDDS